MERPIIFKSSEMLKAVTELENSLKRVPVKDLKKITEDQALSIYEEAVLAGRNAAYEVDEQMIRVTGYPESFPICGFGWVNIKPGNSRFANMLKNLGIARNDSFEGGVCIWIIEYNQGYDKKYAHAKAMAEVFQSYGIKAYAGGRLD